MSTPGTPVAMPVVMPSSVRQRVHLRLPVGTSEAWRGYYVPVPVGMLTDQDAIARARSRRQALERTHRRQGDDHERRFLALLAFMRLHRLSGDEWALMLYDGVQPGQTVRDYVRSLGYDEQFWGLSLGRLDDAVMVMAAAAGHRAYESHAAANAAAEIAAIARLKALGHAGEAYRIVVTLVLGLSAAASALIAGLVTRLLFLAFELWQFYLEWLKVVADDRVEKREWLGLVLSGLGIVPLGRVAGMLFSGVGLGVALGQFIAEVDGFLEEVERSVDVTDEIESAGGALHGGYGHGRIAFSEFDILVKEFPHLFKDLGRSTEAEFRAKVVNGKTRLLERENALPVAERRRFALEAIDKPHAFDDRGSSRPFEASKPGSIPRELTYVVKTDSGYDRVLVATEIRAGDRRPDYVQLRYTMDADEIARLRNADGTFKTEYARYRREVRSAGRRIRAKTPVVTSLDINTRLFGSDRLAHLEKHVDTMIKVIGRFTEVGGLSLDGEVRVWMREQYHNNPEVRGPLRDPRTGAVVRDAAHILTVPGPERLPGESDLDFAARRDAFRNSMRWTIEISLIERGGRLDVVRRPIRQRPAVDRVERTRLLAAVRRLRDGLKALPGLSGRRR